MRIVAGLVTAFLSLAASAERCLAGAVTPLTMNLCLPGTFGVTCNPDAVAADPNAYIRGILLDNDKIFRTFAGILLLMLVAYGIKLAATAHNDNSVSEARLAYMQALVGAILVGAAYVIGDAFSADPAIISDTQIIKNDVLEIVIQLLVGVVVIVVIANIVIQGIRLIISLNEGGIETARKNFIQSLAGGAMVMIVVPLFNALTGLGSGGGNRMQEIVVGIANFLGAIFGVLAVAAFVIAGIMLVVSVNESLKDRARSLMIGSLIAIVVVVASLGIISFLLP